MLQTIQQELPAAHPPPPPPHTHGMAAQLDVMSGSGGEALGGSGPNLVLFLTNFLSLLYWEDLRFSLQALLKFPQPQKQWSGTGGSSPNPVHL